MKEFRELKANEILCRVNTINENGLTLLLYKDARVDMDILDETVGSMNWQREHRELKENIYCGVSIWDNEKSQWVTKWDAGKESNTQAEKGESSDSFKRACVNWGIGRELYTAPLIWISKDKTNIVESKGKLTTYDKFYVEKIAYKDKVITGLAIKNQDNKRVFVYATKYTGDKNEDNK